MAPKNGPCRKRQIWPKSLSMNEGTNLFRVRFAPLSLCRLKGYHAQMERPMQQTHRPHHRCRARLPIDRKRRTQHSLSTKSFLSPTQARMFWGHLCSYPKNLSREECSPLCSLACTTLRNDCVWRDATKRKSE